MILHNNQNIIEHEGHFLTYEPPVVSSVNECLIHVIQGTIRPTTVNLTHFNSVTLAAGEPKRILFPDVVGFAAFALAYHIPLRRRWFISPLNQGNIGGLWEDVFMNLWPDPVLMPYMGILYRVYWTSYRTNFSQTVELWAQTGELWEI